jgi:hypothetical protein
MRFSIKALAVLALIAASEARAEPSAMERVLQQGEIAKHESTATAPASGDAPAACVAEISLVAVGINVVTDDSCKSGVTGCIADSCRKCKCWESQNSSELPDCRSLQGTTEHVPLKGTSLSATPEQTGASAGLNDIGDNSAKILHLNVIGTLAVAVAVAAMAFVAKKVVESRREPTFPDSLTPTSSLVYRRASVFQI